MEPSTLRRIRRNHAIEHAAMHMLARTSGSVPLAARSDWRGLTFYGDVDTATLKSAIDAGLHALNTGQRDLAVHPRCGSMVSVSVLLGTLVAWLVQSGLRRGRLADPRTADSGWHRERTLVARPFGETLQAQVLTDARIGRARLLSIRRSMCGPLVMHRVTIGHT